MRFFFSYIVLLIFSVQVFSQVTISSGLEHTILNCGGESFFVAGRNNYGQLGVESEDDVVLEYTSLNPGMQMTSIKVGYVDFSVGLTNKGEVMVWGRKIHGVSGTGAETSDNYTMEKVVDMYSSDKFLDSVVQIEVASNVVCALLSNGKVVTWGSNKDYLLGANMKNAAFSAIPVYVKCKTGGVIKELKGIKKIAAGFLGIYALDSLGYVWGWGPNFHDYYNYANKYQLKFGTTDTLKNIVDISACGEFCLMLSNTGNVYGTNEYRGSVGLKDEGIYKSYVSSRYPSRMPFDSSENVFLSNVISISAGFSHSVAVVDLEDEQVVYAWGDDKFYNATNWSRGGQLVLGHDSLLQSIYPVEIARFKKKSPRTLLKASAVAGYTYLTVEERGVLKVEIAGANPYGKLGIGTEDDVNSFQQLSGGYCRFKCPFANLGNDRIFCEPFNEILSIPYDSIVYDISWYINDSIIDNTNNEPYAISVSDTGMYKVLITDTTRTCDISSSQIYVNSKAPDFNWLDKFTYEDTLYYYVQGETDCQWFKTRTSDSILSKENVVAIEKSEIEDIDSYKYYLWVKTSGCQRMPIARSVYDGYQTCGQTFVDTLVKDNCDKLYASAKNIEWFIHKDDPIPFWIGDTLRISSRLKSNFSLKDTAWTVYAKEIRATCDVRPKEVNLTECKKPFKISGSVRDIDHSPVESWIYLYYLDNLSDSIIYIDSVSTDFFGLYDIRSASGPKKMKAIAKKDTVFQIFLGNKTSFDKSFSINVETSISSLDLTFDKKVGIGTSELSYIQSNDVIILNTNTTFVKARIISIDGRVIKETSDESVIDIADLIQGAYILQVISENTAVSNIFFKSK